jgi:hypothetical protein
MSGEALETEVSKAGFETPGAAVEFIAGVLRANGFSPEVIPYVQGIDGVELEDDIVARVCLADPSGKRKERGSFFDSFLGFSGGPEDVPSYSVHYRLESGRVSVNGPNPNGVKQEWIKKVHEAFTANGYVMDINGYYNIPNGE